MLNRFRVVFHALRYRRSFEQELSDELRFHLQTYTDDLIASGVPAAEARQRARVEFGNVDNVALDCREARGLRLFDTAQQDVRHGLRLMRRTPALSTTAVATVALCLGANLALFAVVDAVLLRPLPFPRSDRLVRVFNTYPKAGVPDDGVSLTNYYERRGRIAAFSRMAIHREHAAIVGDTGATEREDVARVSPDFFETLGVTLAAGRAFGEAETFYGTDRVAIVTDGYRRDALGEVDDVIGRTLRVDGVAHRVVGLLPPSFRFLSSQARIYLPLASAPEQRGPDRRHWGSQADMIARLAPGTTLPEAQAQVDAHNATMERTNPEARAMADAGFRSVVVPLRAAHVASVRPTLLLVQAGALCLLGIGVVNLVNLLLIRAAGRVKELAVRQAIGASRRHVVAEVLVETLLVVVPGALAGTAIGAAGVGLIARLGADRLPLGAGVSFDPRVATAAVAASVVIAMIVAVPVAWYSLRAHSASALQSQSRTTTTSRAARRLRHAFLVTQVAMAFVLVAAAGLLALSLARVREQPSGFRPAGVLAAEVTLPWKNYPDEGARLTFTERVLDALSGQPGVRSAGVATNVPLSGNAVRSAATLAGRAARPGEPPHAIYSYGVGGDYFASLGIPLREGRYLTSADERQPDRVCVVDEAFARRNFPAGRAVGARLFMGGRPGPEAEAFTIVGVVGSAKQASLTEDGTQGAVFYPYPYRAEPTFFVVVRTTVPAQSVASILQRVVRRIDGEVAVADVRTMEARVEDSLLVRRSPALLAGIFAAIALLLTAIGTYGVLAHAVVQRRREIGVRIALGARPAQVRAQFLGLAARLFVAGSVAGLAGAWAAGRAIGSVLFAVPPLHPPTLALAAAVLGTVSLTACLLPAYRASHVAPTEVLAEE